MKEKTNVKSYFKERFAALRADSGLSQNKLGKALSLSPATIGYYENGDRLPDIETAARIANYFNVSADYLLGLSDVKSTEQDMKTACKVTGLSEKAINNIKSTYYLFPRLEREGTEHALSTNPIYGEYEREACEEYIFAHSERNKHVAVNFLESESFERMVYAICEACEKKEEATVLMNEALTKNINVYKRAYEANAQYKASILDTYELIKKFVDSYTSDMQEVNDNAQMEQETTE